MSKPYSRTEKEIRKKQAKEIKRLQDDKALYTQKLQHVKKEQLKKEAELARRLINNQNRTAAHDAERRAGLISPVLPTEPHIPPQFLPRKPFLSTFVPNLGRDPRFGDYVNLPDPYSYVQEELAEMGYPADEEKAEEEMRPAHMFSRYDRGGSMGGSNMQGRKHRKSCRKCGRPM